MVETYWTLSQAYRWIIWRSVEIVASPRKMVGAEYARHRGGTEPRMPSHLEARAALLGDLQSGAVVAVDQEGGQVPAEVWAAVTLEAVTLEWDDEGVRIIRGDASILPINPKVPSAAVMVKWPSFDGTAVSSRPLSPSAQFHAERFPNGPSPSAQLPRGIPRARPVPAPQEQTLHPEHLTIFQHAQAWIAEGGAPLQRVGDLAAEMVRLAAAGYYEVTPNESGEPPANVDLSVGCSFVWDEGRNIICRVATYDLEGAPIVGHKIKALAKAVTAHSAAHEIRLRRDWLQCWRISERGIAWARDRGLSVPEPQAAPDSAEPAGQAPAGEPECAALSPAVADDVAPPVKLRRGPKPGEVAFPGDPALVKKAISLRRNGKVRSDYAAARLVSAKAKGASPEAAHQRIYKQIRKHSRAHPIERKLTSTN